MSEAGGNLKIVVSAEGVTFPVHVQPRASRNELCGLHGEELKLRLTSPPVEDAANKLCIEFLARQLGENDAVNAETLPRVRMPNRDGFIVRFPDKI